jgi:hypothetical protein
MKWITSSVAVLVAAVLSVGAAAQASGTMAKGDTMDKMEMTDATYTGCIEAGTAPGTFMLTHVAADAIGKDAMKKDSMNKDPMAKDTMAPTALTLASSSVDLSKHLDHKVAITGSAAHDKMDAMGKDTMVKDAMMKDASAFTVKSLKMVAASCS